jgi:flagellar FliL protein
MKKILLGLVALALLGGVGFGAYMFFGKPAEAAVSAESKEGEKAAEEHAAKEGEGGPGAVAEFVKMDPLVLPIVDNNGVSQVVNLVIALEVDSPEKAKEVERLLPRLKDAYIQDLYGVLTRQAAMDGGILQVGYIKMRLNKITVKILGEDRVKDVLLQTVQQRPA